MKLLSLIFILTLGLTSTSCTGEVQSQTAATPTVPPESSSAEKPVRKDVPYVPTSIETVHEMLRLAQVSDDDVVYDLGSGDGRIVITAARDYGARGVGIEIDPERISEANANAREAKVTDRVRFIQGDLFSADLSDATAVTLYLLPSVNVRLRPKLLAELPAGTPVVSHDFDMAEWEPDEHVEVGYDDLYLWIIPAEVDGDWKLLDGNGTTELKLKQEFQTFRGTATRDGRTLHVRNGRISGEDVSFEIAAADDPALPPIARYTGRVQGDQIEGSVAAGEAAGAAWRARR